MPLQYGGLEIDFEPGSTQEEEPQRRRFESKADARADAVEQFRKAAQKSTRGNLNQAVEAVLALVIQLRAVGGNAADTDLGKKMREAADFLEDL